MIIVALLASAAIMTTGLGMWRMTVLWSNRDQIRDELAAARLAEIRHELDMEQIADSLRFNWR